MAKREEARSLIQLHLRWQLSLRMDRRKNRYRSYQSAISRPVESKKEALRDQAMGNRLRNRGGAHRCTSGEHVFGGTAGHGWKALGSGREETITGHSGSSQMRVSAKDDFDIQE